MTRALPATLVLLSVACSGPTVVDTDDASTSAAPPPPPASSTTPSNAHLVNAFAYAMPVNGATGYYFTTPSGRWECAILPRVKAGGQNAQGSTLGIAGAPDEVLGPDGGTAAPTALVLDRSADPQFAAQSPAEFGLDTGKAAVLPFNRVLAAAGFRCNVQEATGVSCLSELSAKGFTFSADGVTLTYTDVPAAAP